MNLSDIQRVKIIGSPIGSGDNMDMPRDGDGDGMYTLPNSDEDNVPLLSAMRMARNIFKRNKNNYVEPSPRDIGKMIAQLNNPGSGFTKHKRTEDDVKSGVSIARARHGIRMRRDEMFDENGEPSQRAIDAMLGLLRYHGKEVFDNPRDGAREVGIGGWHNDETGEIDIDIVDIHENPDGTNLSEGFRQRMYELGKRENQIGIANLDGISAGKGDMFIPTDGNGTETLDIDALIKFGKEYKPHRLFRRKPNTIIPLTSSKIKGILIVRNKKG